MVADAVEPACEPADTVGWCRAVRLCILMGSADISGGTYVIFEHALHLMKCGWDVTVLTLTPVSEVTSRWHPALDRLKFSTIEDVAGIHFDLAMATWWKTIYELERVDAAQYCYFVQSIESWFYPDDDVALRNLVNSTYLLALPGITEARWICSHLEKQFGRHFHLVPNGCRKDLYTENGPAIAVRSAGRLRVLVEGQLGVDFKNVARTIELVRRTRADEIWLLTISPLTHYPGVDRVFSRLSVSECAAVYRSCDVLVKLSYVEGMFGPPLEMFHCGGTAIVYDVTGHDEYIVSGENAIVVATGDEPAVVASVDRLKADPTQLSHLCEGARMTAARWPDWNDSSLRFEQALHSILAEPHVSRERIGVMTREFFRQYVRAETALNAYRSRTTRHRVASALKRLAGFAAARVPAVLPAMRSWRATRLDRSRRPQPRSKI